MLLFGTIFLWGGGSVLFKKGLKGVSSFEAFFWDAFFLAAPLFFFYGLLKRGKIFSLSFEIFGVAFLTNLTYLGEIFAVSLGKLTLVAPLIATYPFFTLTFAQVF